MPVTYIGISREGNKFVVVGWTFSFTVPVGKNLIKEIQNSLNIQDRDLSQMLDITVSKADMKSKMIQYIHSKYQNVGVF